MQLGHLLTLALVCMTAVPANAQRDSITTSGKDVDAAENFVRAFYAAMDVRDLNKLDALLLPDSKIAHPNGNITDKQQILTSIRNAKDWPPRTRQLSHFDVHIVGNAVVVGLTNQVSFTPVDRAPFENTFTETWILERTDSGLKALRAHYSRVAPR